jgi:hypothetical protein
VNSAHAFAIRIERHFGHTRIALFDFRPPQAGLGGGDNQCALGGITHHAIGGLVLHLAGFFQRRVIRQRRGPQQTGHFHIGLHVEFTVRLCW